MPYNIGTTGEGHPIAANNLVLRRINIRDPQRDIGVYEHDFNQNILLDQTNRCDRYQGRQSFLIIVQPEIRMEDETMETTAMELITLKEVSAPARGISRMVHTF
jgi:hypothetical protein